MRIFAGVLWTNDSGVNRVIENVDFQGFWSLRLRHLKEMRPTLLYTII